MKGQGRERIIEAAYAAFADDRLGLLTDLCAPNAVLVKENRRERTRVAEGSEAVISYLAEVRAQWSDCKITVREYLWSGELVSSSGYLFGLTASGEHPQYREFAHAWRLEHDRITRLTDVSLLLEEATDPDADG